MDNGPTLVDRPDPKRERVQALPPRHAAHPKGFHRALASGTRLDRSEAKVSRSVLEWGAGPAMTNVDTDNLLRLLTSNPL